MTTLYLTEQRSFVRKDGDTLVVQIPADEEKGTEKRKVRVPLVKVDQVVVMGDSTISTPALLALLEQKADVCFCSYYGDFRGRLAPGFSKNSLLRLEQHRAHQDPARSLPLARAFVQGKLANQRTLLLRSNRNFPAWTLTHSQSLTPSVHRTAICLWCATESLMPNRVCSGAVQTTD